MRYIIDTFYDPRINLAMEEYIFRHGDEEGALLLWQNEPTIVVGKHQNTWNEINQDFVKERDIHVVRRITGGGAVYHDLGNLNFSIITPVTKKSGIDFREINKPIIKALQELGIPCEFSGRNDLVINGAKFSGIAQYKSKDRVLNHGTLLFDSDLSVLSQALKVREDKFEGKGVKSVASRVTNIKSWIKEDLDVLAFKEKLLKAIQEENGIKIDRTSLRPEEREAIMKLARERYFLDQWNYGSSPAFTHEFHKRFPSGSIDLNFIVKEGRVQVAKIYGDFFGTEEVAEIEGAFKGQAWPITDWDFLKKLEPLTPYFGDVSVEDIKELLKSDE